MWATAWRRRRNRKSTSRPTAIYRRRDRYPLISQLGVIWSSIAAGASFWRALSILEKMAMVRFARVVAMLAIAACAEHALAVGVLHRFEGVITNVLDAADAFPFEVDQPFAGSFVYDPSLASGPSVSTPATGYLGGVTNLQITIDLGGSFYSYEAPNRVQHLPPVVGQPLASVFITNDYAPGNGSATDQVQVQHNNTFVGGVQLADVDPASIISGLAPTELGMLWFRSALPSVGLPMMLVGDTLPADLASSFNLSSGNQLLFTFSSAASPVPAGVAGRLTSLSIVPEPSFAAMMLPLIALAARKNMLLQRGGGAAP
jgi:hypothetical protein